ERAHEAEEPRVREARRVLRVAVRRAGDADEADAPERLPRVRDGMVRRQAERVRRILLFLLLGFFFFRGLLLFRLLRFGRGLLLVGLFGSLHFGLLLFTFEGCALELPLSTRRFRS